MQCSAVQCIALHCIVVQCRSVQCYSVQCSEVQLNVVQCIVVQWIALKCNCIEMDSDSLSSIDSVEFGIQYMEEEFHTLHYCYITIWSRVEHRSVQHTVCIALVGRTVALGSHLVGSSLTTTPGDWDELWPFVK